MNPNEVTDGIIQYAHGEGLIGTQEVAQAIQGLACLANGKLNPGKQLCLTTRLNNKLGDITNDLTIIPNPPSRTINENCIKCNAFAPARAILANRVVQLTTSS